MWHEYFLRSFLCACSGTDLLANAAHALSSCGLLFDEIIQSPFVSKYCFCSLLGKILNRYLYCIFLIFFLFFNGVGLLLTSCWSCSLLSVLFYPLFFTQGITVLFSITSSISISKNNRP